jgi:hypothetical protein
MKRLLFLLFVVLGCSCSLLFAKHICNLNEVKIEIGDTFIHNDKKAIILGEETDKGSGLRTLHFKLFIGSCSVCGSEIWQKWEWLSSQLGFSHDTDKPFIIFYDKLICAKCAINQFNGYVKSIKIESLDISTNTINYNLLVSTGVK